MEGNLPYGVTRGDWNRPHIRFFLPSFCSFLSVFLQGLLELPHQVRCGPSPQKPRTRKTGRTGEQTPPTLMCGLDCSLGSKENLLVDNGANILPISAEPADRRHCLIHPHNGIVLL